MRDLLEASSARQRNGPAIGAPGRTTLTYGRLLTQVGGAHSTLRDFGVGVNTRVAVVAPNGPELATALLSVATSAICLPLNPEYRESEFDSVLRDSGASVLLVHTDIESPVRRSAQRLGLTTIELAPQRDAEAGLFTLTSGSAREPVADGFAAASNIALVFSTSGTTSRPKRIPLAHATLRVRAAQRIAALELTAQDRCLNMMALHHDAGVQNLLATLASGGAIFCPPHLSAETFFACLHEFQPTWYCAVPLLQRAILSWAEQHPGELSRCGLRFIRAGTAMLPVRLLTEIERVFGAPVVQTYGMTETGTICSTPLPPRLRKIGSVGVPAGAELAIVDPAGTRLPAGGAGEVAVRGPNVFLEYEGDPAATAAAFRDGWFRTGDLGVLDDDGYLSLKGRIKDLINRGGKKVSPHEIEEHLAQHAAVAEAVAFPVPHPTIGEDVAAAVVFRPGMAVTEPELRQFAAQRLADFKVPSRIVVVDEIPKNSTGKVGRQDLAGHFRTILETSFAAPSDPLEKTLARIWEEELHVARVGAHDNFFQLGGDSLRAARTCVRVQRITGLSLSVGTLYAMPTVSELARVLHGDGALGSASSCLLPIQTGGSRLPLFCMHSRWGFADDYIPLALRLGPDQPVYGFQARGTDGAQSPHESIVEMAAHYVQEIRRAFPEGPCAVCGYSSAGVLAWEVAQQLVAQGQTVALLALLDAPLYTNPALDPERVSVLPALRRRIQLHADALRERPAHKRAAYVVQRLRERTRARSAAGTRLTPPESALDAAQPPALRAVLEAHRRARIAYLPRPYPGRIALFLARQSQVNLHYDPRLPGRLATGVVEIHEVSGDHGTLLQEPVVRVLADRLRRCIDRADR